MSVLFNDSEFHNDGIRRADSDNNLLNLQRISDNELIGFDLNIHLLTSDIMCNLENFHWKLAPFEWLILLLVLWDLTWKAIAMWKAARNNQLVWFVCIAIFNTIGILPIIYILRDMKGKLTKEL